MRTRSRTTLALTPLLLGLLSAAAGQELPQRPVGDNPPEEVREEVGIDDRQGVTLPLDQAFSDEQGERVTLRQLLGQRPVVLQLVYFRCPSLCNFALNELLETLKGMSWLPGREFDLVTVSINPEETPNLARAKKAAYLQAYGKPEAAAGWHFLTGTETGVKALAEAVGFRYRFDTDTREYAHSAALFVVSPSGVLSRTLRGVKHAPRTVRLSLIEASEGKVGGPLDRLILYCYHYDARTGVYTAAVMNIMRLAGLTTMFLLGGMIVTLLRRERSQQRQAAAAASLPLSPAAPSGRSA